MSRKVAVGCLSGVVAIVGLCTVLFVAFLLTSCSFNRYVVAAGLPDPDAGFQTGTVAGYNVYVWNCHQGKRIVLYNQTSEMTSGPYKREEAPCGGTTSIEEQLANERKRDLNPKGFW